MDSEIEAGLLKDYTSAEITSIFLHHVKADICYNLLTLIELVPAEQEASQLISPDNFHLERINRGLKGLTVYIGRAVGIQVAKALAIYNDIENGFELVQGTDLNRAIVLFDDTTLKQEPPGGYPLLVGSATTDNLSEILPKRQTDFRVWTKLDILKAWRSNYEPEVFEKILSHAQDLSQKHLQIDLSNFDEHFGNVYLFGCNPILRDCDFTLLDKRTKVMVTFNVREGKSIVGGKLILKEKRGNSIGFTVERPIEHDRLVIEMPYFPDQLQHYLFSPDGILLEDGLSTWMNLNIGMHMQESDVSITIKDGRKKKVIRTSKFSKGQDVHVGDFDFSGARYFTDHQRSRKHEELAKSSDFLFFEGHPEDKARASKIIHKLLAGASERCIFLDPYFAAADLEYAIGVPNLGIEVQVISSAFFLSQKISRENPAVTHGHQLLNLVKQYTRIYNRQKLSFKVLKGNNRSPLHDRYIVIDDNAYLLGSSFNEFGTRATTLVKIPAPKPMIDKAIDWWKNGTVDIQTFIDQLNQGGDEN